MSDSSTADANDIGGSMPAFDWSKTPLGPIAHWSPGLKTAVARALAAADTPEPPLAELHQNEERLRALAALAPAGIYPTDPAGTDHVQQQSATQRSSEQRYRDLVEQAVDGIFVTDLTGRLLDANSSGAKMFGYALAELCELKFRDLIMPGEVARIPEEFAQLGTGGAAQRSGCGEDFSQAVEN